MSAGGRLPFDLTDEAQSAWQASEALSALLLRFTNPGGVCRAALEFVLDALGRPSGAILVLSSGSEAAPGDNANMWVHQGPPDSWLAQADHASGPLRQLIQHAIQDGCACLPGDLPEELALFDELAAILPVTIDARPQALLIIEGQACTPAQLSWLAPLSAPIGRAIQNSRHLHSIQKRARELAILQTELTHMGFSTDFESMQAHMLQGASRILESEASALVMLDEEQDEWMIRKSLGDDSEWIYQINPKSGKGLIKECLRSGEIICCNDAPNDPHFDPSSDGLSGIKVSSLLYAPLEVNGKVLGAIQVLNKRQGVFDEYDRDLLSMIAVLVTNAMHGTRVIQQLKVANADLEASQWELLGSRNTLRALFDNLPTALYIVDQDLKLIAVNKGRAQRAGRSPKELVGEPCYRALFNRAEPCPECRVRETLTSGNKTQRNERRWSGVEESCEWEISSYPILGENDQVTQAILAEQDVTERRRLESILAQSEKLAAVGQLAAGVAHEINNPLTAIIANAQILHRELPPGHDLQESVDLIARAGARATQVVRNLLDFARKEDYHLGLTDLNETLERSLELVQHELLARGVQLEFAPDPKLPTILASQDHLQSVWLNLLLNAIDSMDKSPGMIRIATQRADDEIHISVTDNGKGIPPERLTRIFEPFYTTKKAGRGTGLGLSVSHRIVKQHGGHIRVESQVGVGSKFTVVLPLS
ncbi:MAG: GAF domain-containing protein [Anaerolineales bacterium]|nr:GAF domain-containing protein [Anaerolineales bacterium]